MEKKETAREYKARILKLTDKDKKRTDSTTKTLEAKGSEPKCPWPEEKNQPCPHKERAKECPWPGYKNCPNR
ncbi:hypothetical protein ES702_07410 [subsurface metagenome]